MMLRPGRGGVTGEVGGPGDRHDFKPNVIQGDKGMVGNPGAKGEIGDTGVDIKGYKGLTGEPGR